MTPDTKQNQNASKYPWDKWLRGKRRRTLHKHTDYQCKSHGMAGQIRNAASQRGLSVRIEVGDDWVAFQVVD